MHQVLSYANKVILNGRGPNNWLLRLEYDHFLINTDISSQVHPQNRCEHVAIVDHFIGFVYSERGLNACIRFSSGNTGQINIYCRLHCPARAAPSPLMVINIVWQSKVIADLKKNPVGSPNSASS